MDLDTIFINFKNDVIQEAKSLDKCIALSLDWKKKTQRARVSKVRFAKENSEKRFNTGVMIINNNEKTLQLFKKIYEQGLQMSQQSVSDQKLLNIHIKEVMHYNDDILVLDRVKYNAFPLVSDRLYLDMGLPQGDETSDSRVVHFAGN